MGIKRDEGRNEGREHKGRRDEKKRGEGKENGEDGKGRGRGEAMPIFIFSPCHPLCSQSQTCLPLPLYKGKLEWKVNDTVTGSSSTGRPYAEGGCQRGNPRGEGEGWTQNGAFQHWAPEDSLQSLCSTTVTTEV